MKLPFLKSRLTGHFDAAGRAIKLDDKVFWSKAEKAGFVHATVIGFSNKRIDLGEGMRVDPDHVVVVGR